MLVFIEQRHIEAGQHTKNLDLPRGCCCPIARAICEQYSLPLGSVYVGPIVTWIRWDGHQVVDMGMAGFPPSQTKLYTGDKASEFVSNADEATHRDPRTSGLKPTVVTLVQQPMALPPLDASARDAT